MIKKLLSAFLLLFLVSNALAETGIDASDPTKIYTYAGAGIKYTDFTNGATLTEIRATGNIRLSNNDMVQFELGYGETENQDTNQTETGQTNSRLRWFHLFEMDYSKLSGYRGMATQIDLQLAGDVVGTDGANTVSIGALPAYGINENWSFYLPVNLVNNWDKDFEKHQGAGIGISPLFVYTPEWWSGSYLQIWPTVVRFLSGNLDGEGSANLDLILGGSFKPTVTWAATFQKNFDKDIQELPLGPTTGLGNDWNIFANVTWYF